ncbi:MAG: hypothetical protein PHE25_06445, partial [Candidatus Gracilibacteria bacterium]|nr:hypothetical protein [Candidatus Gracilibacteria bacterium]
RKYSDFIRVNQVITSENSNDFFSSFKFIYDLGVRKFNFLPAYYINWTKKGLLNLKKGFNEILDFYNSGNKFEVVNLENYSDISFFNLGIIIDSDGSIYGTNLILSGKFDKYKKILKIGDIYSGINGILNDKIFLDFYLKQIGEILKKEYSGSVLKSVNYVDIILNNFCYEFGRK